MQLVHDALRAGRADPPRSPPLQRSVVLAGGGGALGSVVLTYNVGGQPYCYSDMTGFVYRKVTLRDLN